MTVQDLLQQCTTDLTFYLKQQQQKSLLPFLLLGYMGKGAYHLVVMKAGALVQQIAIML